MEPVFEGGPSDDGGDREDSLTSYAREDDVAFHITTFLVFCAVLVPSAVADSPPPVPFANLTLPRTPVSGAGFMRGPVGFQPPDGPVIVRFPGKNWL